jgi:hypothetical protein
MNKDYLNCKKIDTSIRRAEKLLRNKAKKTGIYENFGQEEVRNIKDKFIDITNYDNDMNLRRLKLKIFSDWCMNFSDKDI